MKSKTVFILIVILSIILCALSGCSDKTSTSTGTPIDAGTTVDKESFDEYVAYNSLERLKADGGNYKYDNYIFENDQLVFTSSQYWDSDKLLQEFDNGMIFFYYDDISFYRSQNDGEWVFNPVLFGPDGLDNFALIEPIFVPEEEKLIETVSSDEQFIAVTELTEKNTLTIIHTENTKKGWVYAVSIPLIRTPKNCWSLKLPHFILMVPHIFMMLGSTPITWTFRIRLKAKILRLT